MYSTQAVQLLHDYLKQHDGINLAFCVCDSSVNKVISALGAGSITLAEAAERAKKTIIDSPAVVTS